MDMLQPETLENKNPFKLRNGSKIAVIGGGPSGSFFGYFLLDLAKRSGLDLYVDIFEQKDFEKYGPAGCNHCAGVVSESLVQILSAEGINIPSKVLQRGMEYYAIHMDVGNTTIETPLNEKRIAAVFRGAGPLGTGEKGWESFDGYLLQLTAEKGANIINERVRIIDYSGDKPVVYIKDGTNTAYDLVVGATGLQPASFKLFEDMNFGYKRPKTIKTFICEFKLEDENAQKHLGNAMHVFLLDKPGLEFAALIPKRNFVTLIMLGDNIDKEFVDSLMKTPEMRECFPPDWNFSEGYTCRCFPKANIKSAVKPYADRVVLIGDCATSRLYKNGIGIAYVAAKAAATTAVLKSVSNEDFRKYYWRSCKSIINDNIFGKLIFAFTTLIRKLRFTRRGILRMIEKEQKHKSGERIMSKVMWDTFSGSAQYRDIFMRTLKPSFIFSFVYEMFMGLFSFSSKNNEGKKRGFTTDSGLLGKVYADGETIISQGETGDCMYVIQAGTVEIFQTRKGKEVRLAELGEHDFFGEMALFEREVRSATVRTKGEATVLTVDKHTLLGRIQDDPSMAFRIVENMSQRLRELNKKHSRIKAPDRRNWDTRVDDLK